MTPAVATARRFRASARFLAPIVGPKLGDLRRLFAIRLFQQMDRLLADHSEDRPPRRRGSGSAAPRAPGCPSRRSAPEYTKPSSSMYCTMTPISSMWPSSMIVGEPPGSAPQCCCPPHRRSPGREGLGLRAPGARGDVSKPEGPGASSSRFRNAIEVALSMNT